VARVRVPGRRGPSLADADDLFDLRAILEGGAIRQVVARATARGLAALDAFRGVGEGGFAGFSRDDAHFHLTIAELSGNRRLAVEAARLIDLCDRLPGAGRGDARGAGWADPLRADHVALIDALQARDAARALRLSARHLARTRAALVGGAEAAGG
jgi:DNA-binding GntR family transcriptional regulator